MKLRVKRGLLPVKRVHQNGHWNEKVLPKPKSTSKDIATPTDPPASILNRLRQRRFVLRHNGKPSHVFVLSKAIVVLVSKNAHFHERLLNQRLITQL